MVFRIYDTDLNKGYITHKDDCMGEYPSFKEAKENAYTIAEDYCNSSAYPFLRQLSPNIWFYYTGCNHVTFIKEDQKK